MVGWISEWVRLIPRAGSGLAGDPLWDDAPGAWLEGSSSSHLKYLHSLFCRSTHNFHLRTPVPRLSHILCLAERTSKLHTWHTKNSLLGFAAVRLVLLPAGSPHAHRGSV